jgi:hypothetical protein
MPETKDKRRARERKRLSRGTAISMADRLGGVARVASKGLAGAGRQLAKKRRSGTAEASRGRLAALRSGFPMRDSGTGRVFTRRRPGAFLTGFRRKGG